MAEALWVQAVGVDYSAAEDRRLISAMYGAGVIDGLVISNGGGTNASISAGRCIVSDGAGGAYLAYFDSPTTLPLSISTTNNIYVVVNATTAAATIVTGSTPSSPYQLIGSAVTSATAVLSVSNTRTAASSPTVGGSYLPLTGGTIAAGGQISSPRLVVPGLFGVGGVDLVPNAPEGVRLGGTNPTARHYGRVSKTTAQTIQSAVWTNLTFDTVGRNTTDYAAGNPRRVDTDRLYAGVAGDYLLSLRGYFADVPGADVGIRTCRIQAFTALGAARWIAQAPNISTGDVDNFSMTCMMDLQANDYVVFGVYQSQGTPLATQIGSYGGGTICTAQMRLIQAD